MPDMERFTDDLALHITKGDPIKHAYEVGRIAGKNQARIEIAIFCSITAIIISAIRLAV